ncbi:UTRA domain-containing protein [Sphingomonas changnyeongensis]|uniref:UTRA domain-containing protein n=1 Tax=Sphingomonas changnyeongensis TaxID=2698679 RepID=A0A7Z2NYD1_9SPHN|nr:UTRA domain-containing protein [Sphingomonas changnyeongensis]QHL91549.1 UTRA domain-containing protein [Sphingomonas changnyeongensis]
MTIEQRIRADIEGRIRAGEWKPGHRIPYEHELVAQYGCARATVGKALAALARSGLIERRRKAGSFVAEPHLEAAVLDIPDIGAAVAARGDAYRWALRARHEHAAPPADAATALLGTAGPVLLLDGIHHAGDRPFAHEQRLIALDAVPDAAAADFAAGEPGRWLIAHVPWSEARHRISAVPAGRAHAAALDVPPGTACLQIERWTWRLGRGITHVIQLFPGHRYDLVAQFTPAAR